MNRIESTRWLAPDIKEFTVAAPRIARKAAAGQFVIVRLHEHGERIPLTIAGATGDSIRLVVLDAGKTTRLMNTLEAGDAILDVVGPLGKPSELRAFGTVVVVGGGVGAAVALPVARALVGVGNRVVGIVGARDAEHLILLDELGELCDELHVTTDDGSAGERGLVTVPLGRLIESASPDAVHAAGPIAMMRAVAEATRPAAIPTTVSLNSIMLDGTGMCGGCRVAVAGESRFACVDGPEFDAHTVDFDALARRNAGYRAAEREALERYVADPESSERLLLRCRLAEIDPEVARLRDEEAS